MRLTLDQKMAGTAFFLIASTLVIGPLLWATGMTLPEVAADRALNVPLTVIAASQQDRFRRITNRFIERWRGRKRYQVLRPVCGIGELFLVQALLYGVLAPFARLSEAGLLIGLVNLLAGSTALWVWQEKWRWILAQREWGRRKLRPRLAWAREALKRIATRRTA